MKRIANIAIASLFALGLVAAAQDSSNAQSGSSLGDYARQVKKPGAAAKPKVYDNDNLPTSDKLSIVGPAAGTTSQQNSPDANAPSAPAPAASEEKQASGASKGPDGSKTAAEEKPAALPVTPKTAAEEQADKDAANKQWGDKLQAQKDQIALLARELDVLQREYQVRAAAMYADAGNRMRNSAEWDKQDAQYKQQIADKQKALEDAKQRLEDMGEEARKAGIPSSVREAQ